MYDDYLSAREELPPLDEGATKKLRLLTLASMASKEKLIAYADLQKSLHIDSVRELEDLIIEGASQNVVQGKLDQKNRRFEVEYAMARDIQKVRTRIAFTHSRWFLLIRSLITGRGTLRHQDSRRLVRILRRHVTDAGIPGCQSEPGQSSQ